MSLFPRRSVLRSLAALIALPRVAPAEGPEPATVADLPDAPVAYPDGVEVRDYAVFDLGGHHHWRISFDGESFTAEPLARWEVPSIVARGQPEPVETKVGRGLVFEGAERSVINRRWRAEDVAGCALCPSCKAMESRDGSWFCLRMAPAGLAEADAPLFRTEMPRD